MDICVICAKVEEMRQVVNVFDKKFKRRSGSDIIEIVYEVGVEKSVGGSYNRSLKVKVVTCSAMGNMAAAVRTAQMVAFHQPALIFFVGTAASLKPEKIQVGDVVVPRRAVRRIYEKISERGQKDYESRRNLKNFKEYFFSNNALISDTITVDCSESALGVVAATQLEKPELVCGETCELEIGGMQFRTRRPQVIDDVDIFSCGMVVDSVSYRDFLNALADQHMRKVGIIDMESFGFFKAIEATRLNGAGSVCEGVMVRGISDYAGRKEQSEKMPQDWKKTSVINAAIVTAFIIDGLLAGRR